jgi:hypothetical protein
MRMFLAVTAVLLSVATPALAQSQRDLRGAADDPTPRVRILEPKDQGTIKAGAPFTIKLETEDFDFAYKKSTTPGGPGRLPARYNQVKQERNSGHVHVYVIGIDESGGYKYFLMPQNFIMPQNFVMPNKGEFEFTALPKGRYKILIELVAHDHTPRVKKHPRDWPSLDIITITAQ